MAQLRWPVRTPPVRPPNPKPVWPPVINPPDPVVPPGTPPVDIGPIVVTPVDPNPPKPVEPVPPVCMPGMWSDGWVLLRQGEGVLRLDSSKGTRSLFAIQSVYGDAATARDVINQILGVIGTGARATNIEPWPPVRTDPIRQKGAVSMAEAEEIVARSYTLADIAARLDVVLLNGEQQNTRLSKIEKHLAGALPEVPPAQQDHWAAAYALAEEPPGLDVPLDVFSPEKAALYAVFQRSVINGSPTFAKADCISLASTLTFGTAIDADGQRYLDLCVKYSVDRDVAIFALLTGLVDPYEGGLGARLERDVAALAGTYKPETLSDGTVVSRFVRLDFEGAYRKLLPSGSGGTASGNEG